MYLNIYNELEVIANAAVETEEDDDESCRCWAKESMVVSTAFSPFAAFKTVRRAQGILSINTTCLLFNGLPRDRE